MLTVLTFLGVLAALFFAAALATRDEEQLQPAPPDTADLLLPEGRLRAEDVAAVRFGLAPRGYRMSEVDAVLERLGGELAARDAELAGLRGEPAAGSAAAEPAGAEATEPAVPAEPAGVAGPAGVAAATPATPVAAAESPPAPVALDKGAATGTPGTTGPSGIAGAGSVQVGGGEPDLSAGEAPREPVDPPSREDSTLPR